MRGKVADDHMPRDFWTKSGGPATIFYFQLLNSRIASDSTMTMLNRDGFLDEITPIVGDEFRVMKYRGDHTYEIVEQRKTFRKADRLMAKMVRRLDEEVPENGPFITEEDIRRFYDELAGNLRMDEHRVYTSLQGLQLYTLTRVEESDEPSPLFRATVAWLPREMADGLHTALSRYHDNLKASRPQRIEPSWFNDVFLGLGRLSASILFTIATSSDPAAAIELAEDEKKKLARDRGARTIIVDGTTEPWQSTAEKNGGKPIARLPQKSNPSVALPEQFNAEALVSLSREQIRELEWRVRQARLATAVADLLNRAPKPIVTMDDVNDVLDQRSEDYSLTNEDKQDIVDMITDQTEGGRVYWAERDGWWYSCGVKTVDRSDASTQAIALRSIPSKLGEKAVRVSEGAVLPTGTKILPFGEEPAVVS